MLESSFIHKNSYLTICTNILFLTNLTLKCIKFINLKMNANEFEVI